MFEDVKKNRFWMPRRFVDELAKDCSPYTQSVYMALCRYADVDGFSFWGCRRIAEKLGINKDTVANSIRKLIASGLIRRGFNSSKKVSGVYVLDVRYESPSVSTQVGLKEVFKEDIKKDFIKNQGDTERHRSHAIEEIRKLNPALAKQVSDKFGLPT
jgi:predicted transcriptional regulator